MRTDIISWDNLFLELCGTIAKRSKDPSTRCGAVLVDSDHVILSTGFNGPPSNMNDSMVPWNDRPQKYGYIIHAEENALLYGMEFNCITGSTLYCTHAPCADCILRCIRAKIKEVVIPANHSPYPMSKYQVEPNDIINAQMFPKLEIREV